MIAITYPRKFLGIILRFIYLLHLQVHMCMSGEDTFPNLHGQLDVTGLAFQIFDAPSCFSVCSCFICSLMRTVSLLHGDICSSVSHILITNGC